MKRITLILIFFLLLIGCSINQPAEEDNQDEDMNEVTGKHVLELEKTACNSADNAGTCSTRLANLGFITKEECCEKYQKCC